MIQFFLPTGKIANIFKINLKNNTISNPVYDLLISGLSFATSVILRLGTEFIKEICNLL